jgi:hypothetical protein
VRLLAILGAIWRIVSQNFCDYIDLSSLNRRRKRACEAKSCRQKGGGKILPEERHFHVSKSACFPCRKRLYKSGLWVDV